jgi:ribosomal protein S18 acetylase RimI-like enzyme
VDPQFQNRGFGKALVDFAKAEIADGFWLTTTATNADAQRFYEREGLIHKGDAPHPQYPEALRSRYEWTPKVG